MTIRIAKSIKVAGLSAVAALVAMMSPTAPLAQVDTGTQTPALATSVVPTTKILAIGHWTAKATPKARSPILPVEMRATARLYLAGKIDQWYFKTDETGIVLIMNLTNPSEARALLEKLPLGQAGMMEFEFIPLGPIKPLGLLLSEP
jgi:hypothetical protein